MRDCLRQESRGYKSAVKFSRGAAGLERERERESWAWPGFPAVAFIRFRSGPTGLGLLLCVVLVVTPITRQMSPSPLSPSIKQL